MLAGLAARQLAVELIEAVLVSKRSLDDALEASSRDGRMRDLEARDRGFARLIAATVLRRLGSLNAVVARFLVRPLPDAANRARTILLSATAQILLIGTPVHAAINLAVEQCRHDPAASRFGNLANAVLRRVAKEGPAILESLDSPRIDIPHWIWARWNKTYGEALAAEIATASLTEAALDISLGAEAATDAGGWAERLGGTLLATGSIRIAEHGRIEELAGYAEGAWWVQDAAAALPARLLGPVAGLDIADLCAAPGGKSAALASHGARVTAVELSPVRLERLLSNMQRLALTDRVEAIAADLTTWITERTFDAVLLDAPCTATGTIRRHPDILHLKRKADTPRLAEAQSLLLRQSARLVKPGGRLVYCVCSLEPEEGPDVVEAFLAANTEFTRETLSLDDLGPGAQSAWITPAGDLRTLPSHSPSATSALPEAAALPPGMDGFYAARLARAAAP